MTADGTADGAGTARANAAGVADAAALTARTSYGRLISVLAASTGDLQLAEDALAAAFEQALTTWPQSGVPANPEGWLVTVARNRQRDVWKSAAHQRRVSLDPAADDDGRWAGTVDPFAELDPDRIPDHRLALMFVCAHPAIDVAIRTPLMLQTVLGFQAADIATAYAMSATALAQRIVRAKKRIKDTRIPFVVPSREDMPHRLEPVLEAIYGCYAIAFDPSGSSEMAAEAQYLAVTTAALLGDEPEAWGLAALIVLSMAREPARSGPGFVPLDEQDPTLWDDDLIREGEAYLRRAAGPRPGRFQLEAAIQSVHCARASTGATDWAALRTLYAALAVIAPTLGGQVALAGAVGRVDGAAAGLQRLDDLGAAVDDFQPAWAVRAHLLTAAGRPVEAAAAYERAAELAADPAVRAFLAERAAR